MVIDMRLVVLASVCLSAAGPVWAHGDSPATPAAAANTKREQTAFGIAGDPARVSRTFTINASDRMRFDPAEVVVKRGDTVRFVVTNSGALLHEMVIGTPAELAEHSALMKKFPEMEHDAPYMAHVKPNASGEIVWRFNRAGTFQFACLVAGHFEAGMIGRVVVK